MVDIIVMLLILVKITKGVWQGYHSNGIAGHIRFKSDAVIPVNASENFSNCLGLTPPATEDTPPHTVKTSAGKTGASAACLLNLEEFVCRISATFLCISFSVKTVLLWVSASA
jgi:hypothetical protein